MADQVTLLADVINLGVAWVQARARFRQISDSKKATKEDTTRAAKAALEAATQLEKAIIRLMSVTGDLPVRKAKQPSKPMDWSKIAGAIAKGAGALESALNTPQRKGPITEFIDTEGREVK